MSKAEQFMESLEQHHLVVKVKPITKPANSQVEKVLEQFQRKPAGTVLVATANNALELRPLRGAVGWLPAPFEAPKVQPDPDDSTVVLILAVPTVAESDSY